MKFGNRFKNLLGIKCMKLYSNSFRFHVIIAQCLEGQFFTEHSVDGLLVHRQSPIQVVINAQSLPSYHYTIKSRH